MINASFGTFILRSLPLSNVPVFGLSFITFVFYFSPILLYFLFIIFYQLFSFLIIFIKGVSMEAVRVPDKPVQIWEIEDELSHPLPVPPSLDDLLLDDGKQIMHEETNGGSLEAKKLLIVLPFWG